MKRKAAEWRKWPWVVIPHGRNYFNTAIPPAWSVMAVSNGQYISIASELPKMVADYIVALHNPAKSVRPVKRER